MNKLERLLISAKVPAGAIHAIVTACQLVNESREGTTYTDAKSIYMSLHAAYSEQHGTLAAEWLNNLLEG